MKLENEITVMATCSYEELNKELLEKGFRIKEVYEINDEYMIDRNIDITALPKLEVQKNCILVRDIVGVKKALVYKYKKYADNGDIVEQGKTECPVTDISKAISFMEAINYRSLFNVYDKCIVYTDSKIELIVQMVNDKYVCIEMEGTTNETEQMKEILDSYKLSYDRSNYFVKKAELALDEILG